MLKNKLNTILLRLKKSIFLKNIATLASGTVVALVIPIFMAPILSRIYLPEDYGLLGVFFSVTSLTGILSVLQLNQAVIISESEEERIQIISSAGIITLLVAFTFLILVFLLNNSIVSFFKSPELKYILYLAPLQIIFSGFSSLFMAFLNKVKKYKKMSAVRIIMAVSVVSGSLAFGLSGYHKGLIYALIIGNFIGFLLLVKTFFSLKTKKYLFNKTVFKQILKKYKNFPLFSAPTEFLGTFTNQLPVYIFSRISNLNTVGNFNYSRRMLGLPSSIISSSVGQVFKQQASDDFLKNGNALKIFKKTLILLFSLASIPFFFIYLWGPEIFAFVFGNKWAEAGEYSQILSFMFFLRFIISPLSYMYIVTGHQKEDFFMHILFVFAIGISLFLGNYIHHSVYYMLVYFSASYSFLLIIYLFRSYHFAKGNLKKNKYADKNSKPIK